MKAGIIIDDWKLPIFLEHLTKAGYTIVEKPGLVEGTIALFVISDDPVALAEVVLAANEEAARRKNEGLA